MYLQYLYFIRMSYSIYNLLSKLNNILALLQNQWYDKLDLIIYVHFQFSIFNFHYIIHIIFEIICFHHIMYPLFFYILGRAT